MKRWLVLILGVILVLSLGLTAYAEKPKYGGVLRWHILNDPPKLDPAFATDTTSDRVLNLIYECLVENDPDGKKIIPRLATHWKANKDGTVWTFYLRKGVKFHKTTEGGKPTANGGREVTAEDVKYTLERLVKVKSPRAYFLDMIKGYKDFFNGKAKEWKGIRVLGKYTIQFELDYPFSPFLAVLAYHAFGVVPKEDAEKWGKDFNFHPVGTGPFVFKEWKHDQKVVLTRNPNYWEVDKYGDKLPYLDGVEFVVIPDQTTAYMEFKKGNIDVLPDVADEFYPEVKKTYGKEGLFQSRPWLGTYYYGFNNQKPPFKNNKALRQAINYAINREAISELVAYGRLVPAKGVLPPGMPGYNPNLKGYKYDPKKAKELLKKAGYPNGLTITLQYNTSERHKRIAEAVQAQLKEIGINLKLKNLDWGAHLDACERGETEMFRMGWVVDYVDPDNFLYVLLCSDNWGAKGNYSFYKNPKVDKLLRQARRETDWNKRMKLYQKAEQIIVDDAPWVFLFHYTVDITYNKRVKNIYLPAMGDYMTELKYVWLEK